MKNPTMIIGETKDRLGLIDKFHLDPDCKVILSSVCTKGIGFALKEASNIIWLNEPWNKAIEDQGNNGAHHVGAGHCIID